MGLGAPRIIAGIIFSVLLFSSITEGTLHKGMSDFEIDAVDQGMLKFGLKPEPMPEGKRIKEIFIYTMEPFSKAAGHLAHLDLLHVSTKNSIIKRYLFFKAGQLYSEDSIKDSELYLRRLESLRSLAVIVPVQRKDAPDSNTVDILVVTRDLMSLRPDFDFSWSGDVLTGLTIGLGEYNLFGYNKRVSIDYEYRQAFHLLSARYFDPQLLGSRWQFSVKPSLILARETLGYDGFLADFELKRALLSRKEKWGFGIETSFGSRPVIDFVGAKIRTFSPPELPNANIERRYRYNFGRGTLQLRRSFGTENKKEVFGGYGFNLKQPLIPNNLNLNKEASALFQKYVMPRNEFESYFILGMTFFQERFLTLYDFNNFKLQEIKRLGPSLTLSCDFSPKQITLGDHNFIRPQLRLGSTWQFFTDSFLTLALFSSNRFDGSWADNTIKYGFSYVSPKILGLGRVVLDAHVDSALNNRDNLKYVLGAESGNRGVDSRFYLGAQTFKGNLELRSVPLELWIIHTGAVLFYDVGSAFMRWAEANATHTLGFGLRILAPQVSAEPFRIDLGFPIYGRGTTFHTVVPSIGVGQAF